MKKLLFPLISLAALTLPARALTDAELREIAPNGFSRASVMTVNDYNGTAALTNFPVLVKIAAGSPTGFQYSDLMFPADGSDLGFVDMEGNGLPFEIDEWNPSGTSVLWVKLPSVANGTNFVMVYRSAQTGKSLNAANPFADYVGVWHLGETASGAITVSDSTDNHLDGTASASSSPLAGGAIGGSRRIHTNDNNNGSDYCIKVPLGDADKRAAVDGILPAFTASFWWRHPANYKTRWNQLIGRKLNPNDPTWHLVFDLNNTSRNQLRVYSAGTDGNSHYQTPKSPQTACEKWYKVDLVYWTEEATGYGKYRIYFDGDAANYKEDYTYDKLPAANSTGDFYIGGSGGSRPYLGWMDEVRLRKFVPTADWVKAEYDQATEESFLSKAEVVEFVELPKPVISATRGDFGAAFAQFSGAVSQLGGDATSCDIYAKVWPASGTEPATGSLLASHLVAGGTFTDKTVTNLTPQTEYRWKIYAVNDLTPTAYESDPVEGAFVTAGVGDAGTGGAVARVVDDYVHTFTMGERGETTFAFVPPAGVTEVSALLVGGGGPGGFHAGGGGGAGGLLLTNGLAVTPLATYTITVGTGGVASTSVEAYGANGGDSSMVGTDMNLAAVGGGAGGNGPVSGQTATVEGKAGGSGGGSTRYNAAAGAGTTGQGNAGGIGLHGGRYDYKMESGGGGGAGGVGGPGSQGSTQFPGTGGAGTQLDISGTAAWYAGGGSGGGEEYNNNNNRAYPVFGGIGGGGRGGMKSDVAGDEAATSGTDGLGGGGGGGSAVTGYEKGGNGGSGVVVIRYGAGGSGVGVVNPMLSLTGLTYDDESGDATATYRVGWAGDGYDTVNVSAIYGYSEDNLAYTNANIATGVIGKGTGTVSLPRVSKTVYVRLLATNAGNYTGVSPEVKSLVLFNPAAPVATVSASQTLGSGNAGVSKAALTATVTDLGAGATSVNGVFQICPDKFFDPGTYTTFAVTNGPLAATGVLKGGATGLLADTTYWVRAVLTNDVLTAGEPTVFDTEPVSFTTGACGWPWGRIVPSNDDPTFTVTTDSISAEFSFRGVGEGAVSGSAWMEVSATSDFATVLASSAVTNVVAADIPATCNFTVSGLQPETAYYVRYRVRNNGGRETSNEKSWAFTTASEKENLMLLVW